MKKTSLAQAPVTKNPRPKLETIQNSLESRVKVYAKQFFSTSEKRPFAKASVERLNRAFGEIQKLVSELENPTKREMLLMDWLELSVGSQRPKREVAPVDFSSEKFDVKIIAYVIHRLLDQEKYDDLLNCLGQIVSSRDRLVIGSYFRDGLLTVNKPNVLSEKVINYQFKLTPSSATPVDLEKFARCSSLLVPLLKNEDLVHGVKKLIECEFELSSRVKKLSLSKECILALLMVDEQTIKQVFELSLNEKKPAIYIYGLIKRSHSVGKESELQKKLLKCAALAGLDRVFLAPDAWKGLDLGEIASFVEKGIGRDQLLGSPDLLLQKLLELLKRQGGLGNVFNASYKSTGMIEILKIPVIHDAVVKSAKNSKLSQKTILGILFEEQKNEIVFQKESLHKTLMDAAEAKRHELLETNKLLHSDIDARNKKIEELLERLKNFRRDEMVARDEQLRQAQLRALEGLVLICDELRRNSVSKDRDMRVEISSVLKSANRIVSEFGISVTGEVGSFLPIDHEAFKVIGKPLSPESVGCVVSPAYILETSGARHVLLRGTMTCS